MSPFTCKEDSSSALVFLRTDRARTCNIDPPITLVACRPPFNCVPLAALHRCLGYPDVYISKIVSMASSTPAPAALQQPLAHDTPAVAPAPDAALTPVEVAPRPAPIYKPTPVAAKKAPAAKQAKSGPNVGLIAGAAVAAVTVIAAGVGVMMSGKKAAPEPAKKASSRPAAAARPAAKAGSAKAPTRWGP